ncbi:hypothetical protein HTSR_0375 [Halodesulfurarchaeum formicicum]|uniref:Alpha-galactosidase NEW3 domain-containing protein n=2 Tax=Halodesulfurarchaeum formicicum TaxID=1873524 RepID=A0A1D8S2J0_9EURY|nr:hypothetical protein HTSR_0375 [Halodesulfurarchaeum formicicum]
MMKQLRVVLLAVLVAGSVLAVPVAAIEDPRFETMVSEPQLQPGVEQSLAVTITNDDEDPDDRVETASNVLVTATGGSTPIEVRSGQRRLADLPDGASDTVEFTVEVPADLPGGTYELPIEITYEYEGDERETDTIYATVEVPERPIFEVTERATDLYVGETGVLNLSVRNNGSLPATDATLAVAAPNSALTVGEGTANAHVTELAPGSTTEIAVPVTASQSAVANAYPVTVTPTYNNENGIERTAPSLSVGATPKRGVRIDVREVTGTVVAGETNRVEVTLENAGSTTLTESVLHLEAVSPGLTFDGAATTAQFLGAWAPGETRTVSTDVTIGEGAEPGDAPIEATVAFVHPTGLSARAGPTTLGVGPPAGGPIEFDAVEITHQGPGAVLSAQVTNQGEKRLENAVATLESVDPTIDVGGPATIGTLDPDETATIAVELDGAPGVNPATGAFQAQLQYDRADQPYRSDRTTLRPAVTAPKHLFEVTPRNATFEIDATNELRVTVENEGETQLTDLRARLSVREPYTSQSPTAFVESLGPGESAILTFEVTTPEDGVPTTDVLSLNLTAETPADRTVVDGPHRVPVTIDSPSGGTSGSTAVAIGAVVVILILAGGWWWLNR